MNNELTIIELDKVRTLKYGIKAIKQIEKLYKCNIAEALQKMTKISADEVIKLLHIGLSWEDAELTIDQVENFLDEYLSFGDALIKLTEAIGTAMGGVKNAQGIVVAKDQALI
jgi:hypothetical protein